MKTPLATKTIDRLKEERIFAQEYIIKAIIASDKAEGERKEGILDLIREFSNSLIEIEREINKRKIDNFGNWINQELIVGPNLTIEHIQDAALDMGLVDWDDKNQRIIEK